MQWVLVVPKVQGERKQPFPVAFFGHGVTGHADETLLYGGDFARQGVALIGYNYPGHGLVLGEGDQRIAKALLTPNCVVPFFDGILGGRAHDLNGDGVGDSGAAWWTAHIFHTRDNVRQGILDGMNLVRILRSFDGRIGPQDVTGDGKPDVAGDFDGNGVPDVGGPNVSVLRRRRVARRDHERHPGRDRTTHDRLRADVRRRRPGDGRRVPLLRRRRVGDRPAHGSGRLLGPGDRAPRARRGRTHRDHRLALRPAPADGTPSGERGREEPGARARMPRAFRARRRDDRGGDQRRLARGALRADVIATDVSASAIPTSTGDKLDIQIYTAPDVVGSYDGCTVKEGAPVGRRIRDFEQAALKTFPVADPDRDKCDVAEGCQQFRDRFFGVGTPLVAPNEGLGIQRQTPEMRRFRDLAQAALDPGDPIVFAPYYMLKPLYDENGQRVPPHALLTINTVGDNFVQVSSHFAFARAAGALPFLPPTAVERFPAWADYATPRELYERLGRRTPMKFLVDNGVVEGIPRLGRTSAGPACKANYSNKDAALCPKNETIEPYLCQTALYDADWVSEGRLPFDQPHPDVPLRLARGEGARRGLDVARRGVEPRLRGLPFGPDESGWTATERVVGVFSHYLVPEGAHTWSTGDACRAWDPAVYGNALMARFFASGGRDVYYLSHPKTHGCLVDGTCEFFH